MDRRNGKLEIGDSRISLLFYYNICKNLERSLRLNTQQQCYQNVDDLGRFEPAPHPFSLMLF